jgi:DNA-binding NarL/FixJ family response regulator
MTIRVLVVENLSSERWGFRLMLETDPEIEVVGDASNGQEGVEAARELRPDVVVMNVRMPVMDGLTATQRILEEADHLVRILVVSELEPDDTVFGALRIGVSGFLLKESLTPQDLVAGVRSVAAGDTLLFSRRIFPSIERRLSGVGRGTTESPEILTEREVEVIQLVVAGLSNARIAKDLGISESTVGTHLRNIYGKLEAHSRADAVIRALELGLAKPPRSSEDGTGPPGPQ